MEDTDFRELKQAHNKFYNGKKALSYGTPFIFSLGNRSIGKTFYWTVRCIKKFLADGEQFLYVRRYDDDLRKVAPSFFDTVAFKFPGVSLGFEGSGKSGSEFYVNDRLAGLTMALKAANKYKSVGLPSVTTILFDEFINEDNDYLSNEVGNALGLYQTIARGGGAVIRTDVKFIFIGNAVSLYNPYFTELNILDKVSMNPGYYFDDTRGWLVEVTENKEIAEEIANTAFGKMIARTKYGEYSLKNKFYLDSDQFIAPITGNCTYVCTLVEGDKKFGMYAEFDSDLIYISKKVDPSAKMMFALDEGGHDEGTVFVREGSANKIYSLLKYAYDYAKIRFEDGLCRNVVLEYMKHRSWT